MHKFAHFPQRGAALLALAALLCVTYVVPFAGAAQAVGGWPEAWRTDSSFEALWARTDSPVASGLAARSWLWGPSPFAVANEQYAESPTGLRLVEYLDKGRMELNNPTADRNSPWFVTSGLLVREMVQGQIQVGADAFLAREPAAVQVAGDPGSTTTPSYSAFARYTARAHDRQGQVVGDLMNAVGVVSADAPPGDPGLLSAREYDDVTGHNIPAVFVDWARRPGPVYDSGVLVQAPIVDRLFLLGRPITEPYWIDTTIGGKAGRVLVQLFERRTLTYNPANAPEWRVEMGNVGRAYYDWRHGASQPGPAIAVRSGGSGLAVGGWNWTEGITVTVHLELAGAAEPLSEPFAAVPDSAGRFVVAIASNTALSGAIASQANLRAVAEGAGGKVALPFSLPPDSGTGVMEGMLTQVAQDGSGLQLTLTGVDGVQHRLNLKAEAKVAYADGGGAPVSAIGLGAYVAARGSEQNGALQVTRLHLLSTSSRGAAIGYAWAGNNALRVSGRGWPARQQVSFATGTVTGEKQRFAALVSDSRGNLAGVVTAPPSGAPGGAPAWLWASTSPPGAASVAVPVVSLGSASSPPLPRLFVYGPSGGQAGAAPQLCQGSGCGAGQSIALPLQSLASARGEVLGLRAESGTDTLTGAAPAKLAADFYLLNGSRGSTFVPTGTPVYSTGDLPGRPLSLTVPRDIAPGQYALLVRTSWPGRDGTVTYGFLLDVP